MGDGTWAAAQFELVLERDHAAQVIEAWRQAQRSCWYCGLRPPDPSSGLTKLLGRSIARHRVGYNGAVWVGRDTAAVKVPLVIPRCTLCRNHHDRAASVDLVLALSLFGIVLGICGALYAFVALTGFDITSRKSPRDPLELLLMIPIMFGLPLGIVGFWKFLPDRRRLVQERRGIGVLHSQYNIPYIPGLDGWDEVDAEGHRIRHFSTGRPDVGMAPPQDIGDDANPGVWRT
jgi:hypothetical protein